VSRRAYWLLMGALAMDAGAYLWMLFEVRKRERIWNAAVVSEAEKAAKDGSSPISD
jgi:hypothetical protein